MLERAVLTFLAASAVAVPLKPHDHTLAQKYVNLVSTYFNATELDAADKELIHTTLLEIDAASKEEVADNSDMEGTVTCNVCSMSMSMSMSMACSMVQCAPSRAI